MRIPKLGNARVKAIIAKTLGIGGVAVIATTLTLGTSAISASADSPDGTTTTTQVVTTDTGSSTDSTSTATATTSDTPTATTTQAPVQAPPVAEVAPTVPSTDDTSTPAPKVFSFAVTPDNHNNNHHGNDPPYCKADVSLTHHYNASDNTGTVTASGPFCSTVLTVFPTAWAYTNGTSIWPQNNPVHTSITITEDGTYSFGQQVGCGQGDVYATWGTPDYPTSTTVLNGSHDGYNEAFLSDISKGPVTYMNQSLNCWTPPKAPAGGTVSYGDGKCVANAPVGNTIDVEADATTTATFTLNGGAVTPVPHNGIYTDADFGSAGYPLNVAITLTGQDGSTLEFDHTFQAPPTDADCAPPVTTPPSAKVHVHCACKDGGAPTGGSTGYAELTAGSFDTTFSILVNGGDANSAKGGVTYTQFVSAGDTFKYPLTFTEDQYGGSTTVNVEAGDVTLTGGDVIVSTDCLPNSTPTPTPTPTQSTPPVTPAGNGGVETGMHGKQPIVKAASVQPATSSLSGPGVGLLVTALLLLVAAAIVFARKRGHNGTAGVK